MSRVTFEIEGIDYSLPDSISIGDYVKIFKLKDIMEDDYFGAKIIHELTAAPLDKLLHTNHDKIKQLTSYVLALFPQENTKHYDRFTLNGVDYGFLPQWKELSYGEYVDLDTMFTKDKKEILDYLHILTAVMFRPIVSIDKKTNKYEIEKYDTKTLLERSELFRKELDVKYYLGSQFFFIQFALKYQTATLSSLMNLTQMSVWKKMRIVWKNRKLINLRILQKGGVGTLSLTEYLVMMSRNTNKYIK